MRQISPLSSTRLAALFSLVTVLRICSATTTCYYPNGGIASSYQPCSNTADGSPSACCELSSSACSLTGYCYGNAGVMYRGGCTDSSFNAVQCPQKCRDVNSNSFSNINLCPGASGNGLFTCSGSGEFTIDICLTNFTFNAGTPFTPSSAAASQAATAVATAVTPSAASATSGQTSSSIAQTACSDPALIVGLAVGIPLGLLAAFLAAVIFWQHRKYTSATRRPIASGISGPSAPSQGYPALPYTAATSGTAYGTDASMGLQQYPQYYPRQPQQQEEWKPQSPWAPAELQSMDRTHELQEG